MTNAIPSTWPHSAGEMAARIRQHDWSRTSLGPVDAWPQKLRFAVDLILAMPGPATVLWGPAYIQLYNDAYMSIARDRHPALLGRSVAEGWYDAYVIVIAPLLESVWAGRSIRLTSFSVPLKRPDGQFEERLFDTDWSPIRDDTGVVAGVLQTLVEVTDRLEAQTSLRESEARHRLLTGSWAQAVWEGNANGVVMADSPSWRAYTGQTLEEWLGYGWLDAIHPDDRSYAERQWREAIAARGLVDAEFRLRAPDGGWRWTNVRAAPVLDAKGQIEKWVGMNIDIDARKRAEAVFRESGKRQAFLLRLSDVLRAEPDADAVANRSIRMLLDYLRLDRCCITFYRPDHDAADFAYQVGNDTVLPLPRTVRLSDFPDAYHQVLDGTLVVNDDFDRRHLSQVERANNQALGMRAMLASTVRRGEKYPLCSMMAVSSRPRLWSPVEIALVEEAAERTWSAMERARSEAAVRMSEQRFRTLADAVPAMIWQNDANGENRFVNRYFLDYTGRRKEDIAGPQWQNLVHPDHVGTYVESYMAAVRDRSVWHNRNQILRHDGVWHWFDNYARPLLDEHGQYRGHVGVSTDIDATVQAEQALRDSEERYRALSTAGGNSIYRMSADWHLMYQLDSAALAVTAAPITDWVEKYIPDSDLPEVRKKIAEAIRSKSLFELEHRVRLADGGIGWMLSRAVPLMGENGEITEWFGAGSDVTERRHAVERLQASEERLRSSIEVGRVGLWDWNIPTGEIYWSDEHYRMAGYAIGEIEPSYEAWKQRIHPDDRADTENELRRAMAARDEFEREFRTVHPDGSVHWLYGRGRFSYGEDGRPLRMVGAMVEITERREWEERQKVLVAELQHRTRNLIAVVSSIARQTMSHTGPTEAFRTAFADRMDALSRVQGLLAQAGEESVTVRKILELELAALSAYGKGGRVQIQGPEVPLRKSIVQTLTLAIHELATNAQKYGALAGDSGELNVRWATRRTENEERRLFLEWIESGIEIRMNDGEAVTQGGGYGRKLIEKSLPYTLKARTTYVIDKDGLRCTIDLPLTKRSSQAQRP